MADFNIKQGDTRPTLLAQLYNDSSETDLTGAIVMFHMGEIVDAAATITDAVSGTVSYQWVTADTETAGTFDAEFEVTFSDGRIETYPNNKHLEIMVTGQIA